MLKIKEEDNIITYTVLPLSYNIIIKRVPEFPDIAFVSQLNKLYACAEKHHSIIETLLNKEIYGTGAVPIVAPRISDFILIGDIRCREYNSNLKKYCSLYKKIPFINSNGTRMYNMILKFELI